jgi:peptidyl-prolyl cis-trans isomerase A (cyclophilin A)
MLWHRIIKGFVIQTGDPKGDGTGGPGYKFDDEISQRPFTEGVLGMANSGANTNGSQFFIVNGPTAQQSLDGKYTAFAEVTKGMEVVQAISSVEVDENDKPLEPVYLNSIELK